MMWYDPSDLSVSEKVNLAVKYYVEKYKRQPEVCVVRTGVFGVESDLEVIEKRWIMNNHFLIGFKEVESDDDKGS